MELETKKNRISEWWEKNKKTVGLVVATASIGVLYGFVKGMSAANSCWLDVCSRPIVDDESTNRKHVEVSDPAYVDFVEKGGTD